MKKIYFPANKRWWGDHGRLRSFHSFSFGSYYDPSNLNFGALKVLNDDRVAQWKWFGAHPHKNMEIISIVTSWALKHHDDMWNEWILHVNDVQVMSAWSWITHAEMNASQTQPVTFFQIRIETRELWITPRYEQKHFDPLQQQDTLLCLVSPDNSNWSMKIMQDARISRAQSQQWKTLEYVFHGQNTWLYCFQISWSSTIEWDTITISDALAITDSTTVSIGLNENSDVLIIEVPLSL